MRIAIFGLGYVGSVTAACLAKAGHHVVGVEINDNKRALIRSGKPPVAETHLDHLFRENVAAGRLRITGNADEAVRDSDVSLICVGTPSRRNGGLDVDYVKRVCSEIGTSLKQSRDFHVVAVRSTVLPGTVRGQSKPILESASGKRAGSDFGLCSNPEFLREGTAVADFHCPPRTLIGAYDDRSGAILSQLYSAVEAPLFVTDIETAEMVKYVDNAWHALKIGFANEIGQFVKERDIDSHKVMELFCQDKKLNISDSYLRPGFAFGGSCLPKDLRALLFAAKEGDLELPILKSVLESNRLHIQRALDLIYSLERKRIGLLGISFKAGTDDLRESPLVNVAENLIGKGFDLRICDPSVNLASLLGTNQEYIDTRLPHLASLMVSSIEEILDHSELIIVGQNTAAFRDSLPRVSKDQIVIDFVRAVDGAACNGNYHGLCW